MHLIYAPGESTVMLVPESYVAHSSYKELARETSDPPKEGFTYFFPLPGMGQNSLKQGLVRYQRGEFKPLLQGRVSPGSYLDKPRLEFPKHTLTKEEVPPSLASVLLTMPQNVGVIKPMLRQFGIPLPPEEALIALTPECWIDWIYSAVMPLSPLAIKFLRAVERPNGVEFYDETGATRSSMERRGAEALSIAAARRRLAEEAAMPSLRVRASGVESGRRYYTSYSSWTGRIPIPIDTIREGEDAIREYVEEYVREHLDSSDFNEDDTSDGDVDSSDFDSSIEDYGNIQALIDAHPAPPDDDDEDDED
jgi:hypothetical protein